jgi:flagellar hook-basal body complex protein FliE
MSISPITNSPIPSINGAADIRKPAAGSSVEQAGQSFQKMLSSLNQSQNDSDNLVQKLALGEDVDLHQVMIGLEENDVNFRVSLAIRDKLVDAYREVMRMQI